MSCSPAPAVACPPKKDMACGFITIADANDWPAPELGESLIRLNPVTGKLFAWGEDKAWHGFQLGGGAANVPLTPVTV